MDSVKKITEKMPQTQEQSQNSSNDVAFENTLDRLQKCVHGTPVGRDSRGNLKTWDCVICEKELAKKIEFENAQDRLDKEKERFKAIFHKEMDRPYKDFREIPKRFRRKNIQDYKAVTPQQIMIKGICEKYVKNFDAVQDKGTSMIFCGSPGTGKTHLAYAMADALQQQYITAVVVTASDMTSYVKAAYTKPWERQGMSESDMKPTDVIEEFAIFDLLIIDEVGIQTDSEAEKRIFFEIINKRYEEMEPTIIMSNLTLDELTKFIGERVIDRMKEGGGLVQAFNWESYRK